MQPDLPDMTQSELPGDAIDDGRGGDDGGITDDLDTLVTKPYIVYTRKRRR